MAPPLETQKTFMFLPITAQWAENQKQGDLEKLIFKKVARIQVSAIPLATINLNLMYLSLFIIIDVYKYFNYIVLIHC